MSAVIDRRAARAELEAIAESLGPQEIRVLCFLAARLLGGQVAYGQLDVANDRRDYARERAEELGDALVYTAMAELRRVIGSGG
jgi:hypothetical protein